ncbi:MAG: hypothetical protein GY859_24705 [Desulfobacterales bacterium]|nr:hypothetical protein [Desulfobacterales bacterium]
MYILEFLEKIMTDGTIFASGRNVEHHVFNPHFQTKRATPFGLAVKALYNFANHPRLPCKAFFPLQGFVNKTLPIRSVA